MRYFASLLCFTIFAAMSSASPAIVNRSCFAALDFENGAKTIPSGRATLTVVFQTASSNAQLLKDNIQFLNWMSEDGWVVPEGYDYEQHADIVPISRAISLVISKRRVENLPRDDANRVKKLICNFSAKFHGTVVGWYITVDDEPYGGSFDNLEQVYAPPQRH